MESNVVNVNLKNITQGKSVENDVLFFSIPANACWFRGISLIWRLRVEIGGIGAWQDIVEWFEYPDRMNTVKERLPAGLPGAVTCSPKTGPGRMRGSG